MSSTCATPSKKAHLSENENLMLEANKSFEAKDYLTALHTYKLIAQNNQAYPHLQTQLGYTYQNLKKPREAKKHLEKAIELEDLTKKTYTELCRTLVQLGELDNLYSTATAATSLFPDEPTFFMYLEYLHTKGIKKANSNYWSSIIEKLSGKDPFLESLNFTLREYIEGHFFRGHYYQWRIQRLKKIFSIIKPDWFEGKKILELGCGYGDIGAQLVSLGSKVTFSDARKEYMNEITHRYPNCPSTDIVTADTNSEWPFEDNFDLCLHMGLLYHLEDWEYGLKKAYESSNILILETEVCDSNNENEEVSAQEYGFDKAFGEIGKRPSAAKIEKALKEIGFSFERYDTEDLNSPPHRYDWKVQNTKLIGPQYRRFWVCKKPKHD